MAFALQSDLEFMRQMIVNVNAQQQQIQTEQQQQTITVAGMKWDIGTALTKVNQQAQDFEDAVKLKTPNLQNDMQELLNRAKEECKDIHEKVAKLRTQREEEVTNISNRMQIMIETETNVVKRVQSLSETENNVAKVEAGLKDLYSKCEIPWWIYKQNVRGWRQR